MKRGMCEEKRIWRFGLIFCFFLIKQKEGIKVIEFMRKLYLAACSSMCLNKNATLMTQIIMILLDKIIINHTNQRYLRSMLIII